jgi:hypothetical protein
MAADPSVRLHENTGTHPDEDWPGLEIGTRWYLGRALIYQCRPDGRLGKNYLKGPWETGRSFWARFPH